MNKLKHQNSKIFSTITGTPFYENKMNLFSAKRPTFSNVPEFLFYCILYIAMYCTLTGLKIRETHGTQILILSVKSQYLYAYNLF